MSGSVTGSLLIGAGLIGSAYAGISSANTQKDVAGQQMGMAGTVFGEQQGYEQQLHNRSWGMLGDLPVAQIFLDEPLADDRLWP